MSDEPQPPYPSCSRCQAKIGHYHTVGILTGKEQAMETGQIPSKGRIVLYNHPGSADGKYAATQSPAIIRDVRQIANPADEGASATYECELFVFGPKGQHQDWAEQGDGPCQWNWPPRV